MLNITTESGVRLDVSPSTTIEVSMGGLSLLNLQDRTATYTNSFTLPRTKTNEAVFEFASQPTRNNRPVVNVMINKGLFQRQAVLKVLSFDKEYKCSVSYGGDVFSGFKNRTIDSIIQPPTIYLDNYASISDLIGGIVNRTDLVYNAWYTNNGRITTPNFKDTGTSYVKLTKVLPPPAIGLFSLWGVTFVGDLMSTSDFQNMALSLPSWGYESVNVGGQFRIRPYQAHESELKINDIIKAICMLFLCDIKVVTESYAVNDGESVVEFVRLSDYLQNDGIKAEGFRFSKDINEGLPAVNYVNYTNEGVDKNFGGDVFTIGGGVGTKETKLSAVVPKTDSEGYITNDGGLKNKVALFRFDGGETKTMDIQSEVAGTRAGFVPRPFVLSLSGFYSSILNPIFANPVILEAEKNFDPLTADNIMNTRIINSVQLGGRYWVDSFAYNLTTGNSKMKLIKLP